MHCSLSRLSGTYENSRRPPRQYPCSAAEVSRTLKNLLQMFWEPLRYYTGWQRCIFYLHIALHEFWQRWFSGSGVRRSQLANLKYYRYMLTLRSGTHITDLNWRIGSRICCSEKLAFRYWKEVEKLERALPPPNSFSFSSLRIRLSPFPHLDKAYLGPPLTTKTPHTCFTTRHHQVASAEFLTTLSRWLPKTSPVIVLRPVLVDDFRAVTITRYEL